LCVRARDSPTPANQPHTALFSVRTPTRTPTSRVLPQPFRLLRIKAGAKGGVLFRSDTFFELYRNKSQNVSSLVLKYSHSHSNTGNPNRLSERDSPCRFSSSHIHSTCVCRLKEEMLRTFLIRIKFNGAGTAQTYSTAGS
jgi:hypothetical protein